MKKKMSFMDNRVTNNGEWGSSNKDFLTSKKKKEFISLVFKMSNISLTFILIRYGSSKLLNMLD